MNLPMPIYGNKNPIDGDQKCVHVNLAQSREADRGSVNNWMNGR
jgi:hypothetical protein